MLEAQITGEIVSLAGKQDWEQVLYRLIVTLFGFFTLSRASLNLFTFGLI